MTPYDLQVAAVFEDVPENSDFPLELVASYAGFVAHNEQWLAAGRLGF